MGYRRSYEREDSVSLRTFAVMVAHCSPYLSLRCRAVPRLGRGVASLKTSTVSTQRDLKLRPSKTPWFDTSQWRVATGSPSSRSQAVCRLGVHNRELSLAILHGLLPGLTPRLIKFGQVVGSLVRNVFSQLYSI